MAAILKDKLTDWYDRTGQEYLLALARFLVGILWYVFMAAVVYETIVLTCLFIRYLRFMFGKRIAPDARKAIIITGATSGLGLGIAKRLFKLGFTVFACYYNDQEEGYTELSNIQLEAKSETKKFNTNAQQPGLYLIEMDIRSKESIQEARKQIETIMNKNGLELHCLLNNAGLIVDGPFELMAHDNIRNIIDTNVTGAISVAKEFVFKIIKDKGRIVNVSSGMSKFPCARFSLYCSSKAAIKSFSDSLHADLEPYGASCYTIIPGNLFLHGNLVLSRLRQLQHCVAQLSEEERSTYAQSIEKATCLTNSSIVYKFEKTPEENVDKLAKIYNVQLPDLKNCPTFKESEEYKKRSMLELFFRRIFSVFVGGYGVGTLLEDTYFMQGFEDSVRMVNPPRYLYPGNRYYHFVFGPFSDQLPQVALNWLNKLVGQTLEETN